MTVRSLPFLLILFALHAGAADTMPPSVLQALNRAGIPAAAVAIVAQPLDGDAPAISHRAGTAMNPASLMKLVTTLAALETLGPAYTWRTEALSATPPKNGILHGDFILRGSGDPKFTHERLWLLLRELRNRGLREIRGNLILDRTAFAPVAHAPAAFDAKPLRPYNVGPDALLFNFAALRLTIVPNEHALHVLAEPLPADLAIVNRLRPTGAASCPSEWREALDARFVRGHLLLTGDFPRVCGEKAWHLAGLPNAALLHGVFTRLWRELGGEFGGSVREAPTPAGAIVLAASESPPLGELVRDINKFSNNVMAWQLYLTLGSGDMASAEQSIRGWLARKGIDFPGLVIDNGTGLSRNARISAAHLAQLLAAGWKSAVMPEFVASLSIAGVDGTTRRKFNGNGLAGQAHLKTGSLEGVRATAGYLLDRGGRRHLLVFLVNHANAAEAQPAFDAMLEWLWAARRDIPIND